MPPEEFLDPDGAGRQRGPGELELLPEFARTLARLKDLGYPVGKIPRRVEDVAKEAIRALGLAGAEPEESPQGL